MRKYFKKQTVDPLEDDRGMIKAAIAATKKANEAAKQTGLSLYEVESGILYRMKPDGKKIFIRKMKQSNTKLPVHFRFK